MTISEKLIGFLKEQNISYEVLVHPEAFTAQQVAHAIHESGKALAKTVVLNADGNYIMAVIPGHHKVKMEAVKNLIGAKDVRIAPEETLRGLFPDCDLGAMPPLGKLYGMKVVVSESLAQSKELIFNACTHTDCLKMKFSDYQKITDPQIAAISDIPEEAR